MKMYVVNTLVVCTLNEQIIRLCKCFFFLFFFQNIIELWEMVRFMVDVPVATGTSIQNTRTSRKTRQGFVKQARKYLEQK